MCRLIIELQVRELRYCRDGVAVFKGALAYRKGIWLVALKTKNQVTLEVVLWNANGSAVRLSEFFVHENPWRCGRGVHRCCRRGRTGVNAVK